MLPQVFLDFLHENDISPTIYDQKEADFDSQWSRYICLTPGCNITENCLAEDFPSGVEKTVEYDLFYRLLPPLPDNPIQSSALYKNGKIIAMDLASGLAVKYLDIQPGDHVLDLCCAPGTKLSLAGLIAGANGSITGVDISKSRLAVARSLAKKYKLPRVRLFHHDGRTFDNRPLIHSATTDVSADSPILETINCFYSSSIYRKSHTHKHSQRLYDKVLVDTQCTHDGSIKHIWKCQKSGWKATELDQYSPERLAELYQLQLELLENGFKLLQPGGTLIYSTCSLSKNQNEEIIEKFLDRNSDAKPFSLDCSRRFMLRFDPFTSNTGGFFLARLTKINL